MERILSVCVCVDDSLIPLSLSLTLVKTFFIWEFFLNVHVVVCVYVYGACIV